MIIGIDASRANRKLKTGTEWYSYHIIQELKKVDHENHYILYANEPLRDGLEVCPPNFEERILRWPLGKLWTQIRLSWEMLWRPPDVLFIPAHAIPLMHPRRTVVTIHDIGFERLPELYPWYDKLYHRFAVRFAVRHADQIIVPSALTKREIEEVYKTDPKRIIVIHHGYNPSYSIWQQAIRDLVDFPEYFVYVGRLEKKKNIVGLLHAFATFRKTLMQHDRYGLVLVGKPGFGYREIMNTISTLGIERDVDIFPWMDQLTLINIIQHARSLILPSFYEGFGLPVLEGFAAHVPVIASAIPALMEVGGDGAYYVPPYHPEMLAHAMERIATDADLRTLFINRGTNRLMLFSWQHAAEETKSVFARVSSL